MGLRAVAMATVGALMRYAASRLCARLLAGLWSACGRNREGGRSSHHLSAVHPDSAREWVSPFQDGQEAWDSSGLAAGLDDDVESPKSLFVATAEWPRRNLVSFSIYAACRLFDTTPDVTEGIKYFEAIRTLAGMYLRADTVGMAETLQAYGLDTLMQKHTRFVAMLGIIQDLAAADGELGRRANSNFSSKRLCPFGRKSLRLDSARPAASEASSRGATVCRPVTMEQMLMVLMWELEGLLFDYLAQHWHKLDDMLTVNKLDVQGDGMACARIPPMTDLALAPVHPQRQAAAMCAPHGSLAYSVEGNDDECCVLGPEADDNTIVLGNHLCLGCQDRAIANWQRARKAAMRHKVQQLLGTQRELKTMEHLFKELHKEDPEDLHVQGPRQPTVLLLGGGMAAGKSTVREIVGSSTFWSKVGAYAVMVEADAIKGQDPVFKTLSEMKEFAGDQSKLSAFVHEYSTRQAENLLVAAVNQQKDVIMDATMMHAPFVEQTISMIRDHHNQYKRGAGYQEHEDGIVTEEYWVVDDSQQHVAVAAPRPYRIEVIGVTCDPSLAVARGVLRFLRTSRGVPLRSQLRSHRLFAQNWESYAALVDSATLYHTGNALMTMGPEQLPTPKVIAHKSDATRGDMLVNPEAYAAFRNLKHIDDDAESLADLQRSLSISPSARGGLSACPCSDESRLGFLRGCLL